MDHGPSCSKASSNQGLVIYSLAISQTLTMPCGDARARMYMPSPTSPCAHRQLCVGLCTTPWSHQQPSYVSPLRHRRKRHIRKNPDSHPFVTMPTPSWLDEAIKRVTIYRHGHMSFTVLTAFIQCMHKTHQSDTRHGHECSCMDKQATNTTRAPRTYLQQCTLL